MAKLRESNSRKYLMRFTPSKWERLEEEAIKRDKDVSVLIREGVDMLIEGGASVEEGEPEPQEVPLLGYICAGDGADIRPLVPGATVRPPFQLKGDVHCLIVSGDSMIAEFGTSIKDGSYAFFESGAEPNYGSIVHVEIPDEHGERSCFMKKFYPQPDGVTVKFQSLNKKYDDIVKAVGEYDIRGVFRRAYVGEEVATEKAPRSFRKDIAKELKDSSVEVEQKLNAARTQGGEAQKEKRA